MTPAERLAKAGRVPGVRRRAAAGLACLVLAAGPALAADDHAHGHGGEDHGQAGHHDFPFGAPAPASEATRTVTVRAKDTMTFTPRRVDVRAGETVRFVVHNVGRLPHSFVLATPEAQQRHERRMQDMPYDRIAGHMQDESNGMVLQSGETGTLTWRFTAGGPVQFACHIPGHYPAGMTGRIRIE